MLIENRTYGLPAARKAGAAPTRRKTTMPLKDEGPDAHICQDVHQDLTDPRRREPNVYKSDYPNDAQRQLQVGGAGVTGLVERFAVPVIVSAAHVAVFFVAALTGPAPELIGVTR